MKNRLTIIAGLTSALVGLFLVGTAWAATTAVTLTVDNKFVPGSPTVEVGDTVTFTWDGGFHDVVFADGVSSGTPVGDVGTTFSRTFETVGTYPYICTVHEALGMTGTITVVAAAGGGGAGGGGGGQQLPFTGPEDGILPYAGVALVVAGGLVLLRLRRAG